MTISAGDIVVEVGRIAVVTLNRTPRRNAVTLKMWCDIARIFSDLSADRAVRGIILTGAGDHFSTGADIGEFDQVRADAAQAEAYENAVEAASDAVFTARHPTVAAIRGYCLGGACHLAMACDFRVSDDTARIGIPAAKLSIVYGIASTRRLNALVGLACAKRILFGGGQFDAVECLRIGFLDRVGSPAIDCARSLAEEFVDSALLSVSGAKAILNGIAMGSLDPVQAERLIAEAAESRDYREGRAAFAEKRKPNFEGR